MSTPTWRTHPVTPERFDDFADVVNPNRRENHCWCLSHRLRVKDIEALGASATGAGGVRERAMRALCSDEIPPGVVTYRDDTPVGWCHVSPRADIPRLTASRLIRPIDDVPVWSVICLVVRGGHRKQGVIGHLIAGAVEWARSQGAPAVEAYPVDNKGAKIDRTFAYAGTRAMFERAGFRETGKARLKLGGFPRLVMRLDL